MYYSLAVEDDSSDGASPQNSVSPLSSFQAKAYGASIEHLLTYRQAGGLRSAGSGNRVTRDLVMGLVCARKTEWNEPELVGSGDRSLE
jgi:hypothetical protein